MAAAAKLLGMPAVIVMPQDAPRPKRERTAALGAEVVLYDRNARRLFNLEPVLSETNQLRKASRMPQQPEINKVFGVASAAE